ncbi:MAG: GIY-YIG nuclease family protein [Patescibacteria group bacterium]
MLPKKHISGKRKMADVSSWYVYILMCEDDSFYTGITVDPEARFRKHQEGLGGHYTRSHVPQKIIYIEKQFSKSKALKRELEIKGWSRKEKILQLKLEIS